MRSQSLTALGALIIGAASVYTAWSSYEQLRLDKTGTELTIRAVTAAQSASDNARACIANLDTAKELFEECTRQLSTCQGRKR